MTDPPDLSLSMIPIRRPPQRLKPRADDRPAIAGTSEHLTQDCLEALHRPSSLAMLVADAESREIRARYTGAWHDQARAGGIALWIGRPDGTPLPVPTGASVGPVSSRLMGPRGPMSFLVDDAPAHGLHTAGCSLAALGSGLLRLTALDANGNAVRAREEGSGMP